MALTDTSEKNVNHTVMSPELEKKIAAVVQRAEDHERYGGHSTRYNLALALQDKDVQQWLDTMRCAGKTPNTQFPRIRENGSAE